MPPQACCGGEAFGRKQIAPPCHGKAVGHLTRGQRFPFGLWNMLHSPLTQSQFRQRVHHRRDGARLSTMANLTPCRLPFGSPPRLAVSQEIVGIAVIVAAPAAAPCLRPQMATTETCKYRGYGRPCGRRRLSPNHFLQSGMSFIASSAASFEGYPFPTILASIGPPLSGATTHPFGPLTTSYVVAAQTGVDMTAITTAKRTDLLITDPLLVCGIRTRTISPMTRRRPTD